MRENLLLKLEKDAGIFYLSDLHNTENYVSIYHAVGKMSPDDYPLEEWKEAAGYILGKNSDNFNTAESAYQYLQSELESIIYSQLKK